MNFEYFKPKEIEFSPAQLEIMMKHFEMIICCRRLSQMIAVVLLGNERAKHPQNAGGRVIVAHDSRFERIHNGVDHCGPCKFRRH